ncbi:MAG: hypothetical protein ACOX9R_14935, partial [Armatimonadota bacterium]
MTLRRLLPICCAAALIVLVGCQITSPTGSPLVPGTDPGQAMDGQDTDAMSPQQQQLLNKLEAKLEAIEQHGMTLEDALQRLQEQERAAAGPPALVKDLWPAQRVLNAAIEAARSSKTEETLATLNRLETLIAAVTGDLPASEIMVHCERALAYLSQNALDEAGVEMALAYRVADGTKFSTLVPANVISLIQTTARSQIQAGRPREAADVVMTILKASADHESLARMERIENAVAGARAAVARGAWAVVEAELFEAHRELTDLSEAIRPERWSLTGEIGEDLDAAATEAGEATEEAPGDVEADETAATESGDAAAAEADEGAAVEA